MRKEQWSPLVYFRAVPLLLTHPSIVVAPLLAAIVAILLDTLGETMTDPLGGAFAGIYTSIGQVISLMAFGVALIQARDILGGHKGTFDDAWTEARRNLGSIAMAAIGFYFFLNVAGMLGGILGAAALLLLLAVAFFLIYVMPAATKGDAPGQFAFGASYRTAAAHPFQTALLAIAWIFVAKFLPLLMSR